MTPDEQRDVDARAVTDWQIRQRELRASLHERLTAKAFAGALFTSCTPSQRLHQSAHAHGMTAHDVALMRADHVIVQRLRAMEADA